MSLPQSRRLSMIVGFCMTSLAVSFANDKNDHSVAQAVKVFDPAKIPMLENAKPTRLLVGGFNYQAPGKVQAAYEFYKKGLGKLNWKELPNSYVSDMACSGTFSNSGYLISLSTSPGTEPDTVMVILQNHGNVDLKKLPVPKTSKPLYSFPNSVAVVSELKRDDAAAEVNKLLRAQQWEPYGIAGDQLFFKKQSIRLSAFVTTAPAQDGKTVITYSSEQMSADLPAPAETIRLQYSDSTTTVSFDVASDEATVLAFYKELLGKLGWKSVLEKPIKTDFKDELFFRNATKDLLQLTMYTVEEKLRVSLAYLSAAEVDEQEARAKEQIAKKKAAKTDKQLPQLSVELPKDAKNIKATKTKIEFNLPDGKSQPFAESLIKKLTGDGWKEVAKSFDANAGTAHLSKGEVGIHLVYIDTGVIAAEFTITGSGVEIKQAKK